MAWPLVKRAGYEYVNDRWRSPVSRRRPATLADALTDALLEIEAGTICLPSMALLRRRRR
jgi:hypothetical protein